jgi:hypothetical protein
MDANQLQELATNALTGHWPAHLGLHTDAEKIEYLARRLEDAAAEIAGGGEAFEQVDELEKQVEALQLTVDEQAIEIGKQVAEIELLKSKGKDA